MTNPNHIDFESQPPQPKTFQYVALLGIKANSTLDILKRIEAGFSFRSFEKFQRTVALPLGELARLIQVKPRTLTRRKAEGRFQPDESDRLLRASRLFQMAVDLFEGDIAAARIWVASSKKALGGKTPLEFARTEVGAREVENLIGRLEYGVYS